MAAAAYRSRSKIQDGITHDWQDYSSRAADVMFAGIFAPSGAPGWARDRSQLWNEVERVENRKNSQLAREIQLALPHELTETQQRYAVQDFVRDNFVKKGLIADVAIHRAHDYGDGRNVHAHILVTLRRVEAQGWASHKQRDGKRDELEIWRDQWAKTANRHLERHGHSARIDHRSLEEQGSDREAQIHLGKTVAAMEREGVRTERGDRLRKIAEANATPMRRHPQQLTQFDEAPQAEGREEVDREKARRTDAEKTAHRESAAALHRLRRTMGPQLGHVIVSEDRNRADKSWQQILAEGEREARLSGPSRQEQERARETLAQRWQREQAEAVHRDQKNREPGEQPSPEAETMAQRWQREQAERAQELKKLLRRGKAGQDRELEYEQ